VREGSKTAAEYVDSHGQSTIAFAFCRLLGFLLLPRLKATHSQKLYPPETGKAMHMRTCN
jgi:TnpA family transposase